MQNNFIYTNNWFNRNIDISMKLLKAIFNNKKVNILEIGSHEGRSTVWMLENLCDKEGSTFTSIDPYLTGDETSPVTSQTYQNFRHNTSICKNREKLNQYVSLSQDILPKLIKEEKLYDIIYVDGSHKQEDVLFDLNHSDQLLRKGGVILMDDVGFDWNKSDGVIGALKTFMWNSTGRYQLILKEYQCALQKVQMKDKKRKQKKMVCGCCWGCPYSFELYDISNLPNSIQLLSLPDLIEGDKTYDWV